MGALPDRLDALQAVWEAQAQADPLWAVLSEPDKTGRRWDVAAFMATGEDHVAKTLARFAELGGTFPDRELAVDFGSGVGRLAQAWADRFDRVVGIDISPTMIAVSRQLNRHGDRVEYRLNDRPDLSLLGSSTASLVSTHITLQHVPAPAAERYLREFLRVVKPGGAVIFQLPSHYADWYLPSDRDDRPVPAEDRRVEVHIVDPPATMVAGSAHELTADFTNRSGRPWVQSGVHPLRVGNHWRPVSPSQPTVNDDGRARLPGRVAPGETVRMTFVVTAPAEPGRYRLVVDAVQENVAWFEDAGSVPAGVDVDIVPAPPGEGSPAAAAPPAYGDTAIAQLISPQYREAPMFEMNAIHRDVVTAIIEEAGARLLGVDEWVNEWHSFTYYVQA